MDHDFSQFQQVFFDESLDLINNIEKPSDQEPDNHLAKKSTENFKTYLSSLTGWKIYFKPNLMIFQNGDDPLRIIRSLEELGKTRCIVDISHFQEINEFHPDDCY